MNETLIATIADAILNDDDADMLDAYDAIAPTLPPTARMTLAMMLDLCPAHACDAAICADDADPTCAHLR